MQVYSFGTVNSGSLYSRCFLIVVSPVTLYLRNDYVISVVTVYLLGLFRTAHNDIGHFLYLPLTSMFSNVKQKSPVILFLRLCLGDHEGRCCTGDMERNVRFFINVRSFLLGESERYVK